MGLQAGAPCVFWCNAVSPARVYQSREDSEITVIQLDLCTEVIRALVSRLSIFVCGEIDILEQYRLTSVRPCGNVRVLVQYTEPVCSVARSIAV